MTSIRPPRSTVRLHRNWTSWIKKMDEHFQGEYIPLSDLGGKESSIRSTWLMIIAIRNYFLAQELTAEEV